MATFDEILKRANQGVEQGFTPGYEKPIAERYTDETGSSISTTPLNPFLYADQKTADYLGNRLGATVQNAPVSGPLGVSAPQRELQFAPGTAGLNAGLVAQQYGYATQGRYNADTGKYDLEAPHVVQARINADIAREMGQPWQDSYAPSPQQAASSWGWNPSNTMGGFITQPGNAGGVRDNGGTTPSRPAAPAPSATPQAPAAASPAPAANPTPSSGSTTAPAPGPSRNPLRPLNVTGESNPFRRAATTDNSAAREAATNARALPSSLASRGFRIGSTPSSWRF